LTTVLPVTRYEPAVQIKGEVCETPGMVLEGNVIVTVKAVAAVAVEALQADYTSIVCVTASEHPLEFGRLDKFEISTPQKNYQS